MAFLVLFLTLEIEPMTKPHKNRGAMHLPNIHSFINPVREQHILGVNKTIRVVLLDDPPKTFTIEYSLSF